MNKRTALVILLFSWWGMKSLLEPGLWTGHDIWHQVARFYWYHQAWSEGQVLPGWISNLANGYGYPLFLFSYSLEWWFGEVLLRLGVGLLPALKWLFVLSYLASGVSMYYLVWSVTRARAAALLAAVLYLWAPYHFLSIYVQASIGTVFGFWLLPLWLLGIYWVGEAPRRLSGGLMIALAVAGLILSHLITFLFVWPLVGIWTIGWAIIRQQLADRKYWLGCLLGFGLGVWLTAFYLVPAVAYVSQTRAPVETGFAQLYKSNLVNFSQLLYSKWGYYPIINNVKDGEMSMQLGVAQWLSLAVVLVGMFKLGWKNRLVQIGLMLWLAVVVMIWLMTDPSRGWWAWVTHYVTLDYPFRLLLPLVLVGSLAGAIGCLMLPRRWQWLMVGGLIGVMIFTNKNHLQVNQHTQIPIQLYVDSEGTTNTFNEYRPKGVAKIPESTPLITPQLASTSAVIVNTRQLSLWVEATAAATVSARQFGFIGQQLRIDQQLVPYRTDLAGLINFEVPPGQHLVAIEYQPTRLMVVSRWVSLLGLLVVLAGLWLIKPRHES